MVAILKNAPAINFLEKAQFCKREGYMISLYNNFPRAGLTYAFSALLYGDIEIRVQSVMILMSVHDITMYTEIEWFITEYKLQLPPLLYSKLKHHVYSKNFATK